MESLKNKIDFSVIFSVTNANPNGDPLNDNRPRETYEGFGEISDVCLKRKMRNRLMDMGQPIFVQSDDKTIDGFKSLSERAKSSEELKKCEKNEEAYAKAACDKWIDVRSFGQLFAFKTDKSGEKGVSIGIRGPVSVQSAFSISPVDITTLQITKSTNSEPAKKDGGKSSDTMGMKHRVDYGLYRFNGSINCQLAEKTGFSDEDAELIKEALISLFENDSSSARPDGSMEVNKVYWWRHNSKNGQYSSAKVHRTVIVESSCDNIRRFEDYSIILENLEDLQLEIYDGK